MKEYINNKGATPTKIKRTILREFQRKASYYKYCYGGELAKNMARGAPQHEYACLSEFFHMFQELNLGTMNTIRYKINGGMFKNYFAFGSCIQGYYHIQKVIAVDDTHIW